jgi:hypothetical protein
VVVAAAVVERETKVERELFFSFVSSRFFVSFSNFQTKKQFFFFLFLLGSGVCNNVSGDYGRETKNQCGGGGGGGGGGQRTRKKSAALSFSSLSSSSLLLLLSSLSFT